MTDESLQSRNLGPLNPGLIENRRLNPTVYSYFEDQPEGNTLRWYYDLCWETVKAWTPEAVLLSRKDAEKLVGAFPVEVEPLYVAHRSDWIRKAVISRVGGLWVDADFICWSNLAALAVGCTTFDFAGYKEWGAGWMDNFFGARAGSPLVEEMAEHALGRARLKGRSLRWTEMSGQTVAHVLDRHKWDVVLQFPTHIIEPVAVWDVDFFFGKCNEKDQNKWWRCLGFMTSVHTDGARARLESFSSAAALLSSETWLAAIMRRGLRLDD